MKNEMDGLKMISHSDLAKFLSVDFNQANNFLVINKTDKFENKIDGKFCSYLQFKEINLKLREKYKAYSPINERKGCIYIKTKNINGINGNGSFWMLI